MAVYKCKMCGAGLNITGDSKVCECEYCGSVQTVPSMDDEKKVSLFSRANSLRSRGEFDQAINVYESIISNFPDEAEAYWGLLLCRFGIEYVDDPSTGMKVPTCHRASFESIMEDPDFDMVMAYADMESSPVYRQQAKEIEQIRNGIIEVSEKEAPYDVFICYKETDEFGDRTEDSVKAQEVYDLLTEEGYRVFFSRISLEDKLGEEYEPYIFAALNSAKVMLVFGTKYEYFNAVWVKNEWSRFLSMKAKDQKKMLIPCYEYIDAYDMPKEFKLLQAQDMGKIGWKQDLVRSIEKISPRKETTSGDANGGTEQYNRRAIVVTTDSQMGRARILLSDGQWEEANNRFEKILDADPQNAEAYLGELLCEHKCRSLDELEQQMIFDVSYPETEIGNLMDFLTEEMEETLHGFEIPGFLDYEDIVAFFREKASYSTTSKKTLEKFDWYNNLSAKESNLYHAVEFAQGDLAESLEVFQNHIKNTVGEVETSERECEQNRRDLMWNMTLAEMDELNKVAEQRMAQELKKLANLPSRDKELPAILEELQRFGDYEDAVKLRERLYPVCEEINKIGEGITYLGERLIEDRPEELRQYLNDIKLMYGNKTSGTSKRRNSGVSMGEKRNASKDAKRLYEGFCAYEQEERQRLQKLWGTNLNRKMQISFMGASRLFDMEKTSGIAMIAFADMLKEKGFI